VLGLGPPCSWAKKGCKRPAVISTVHSSRVRCSDDRVALRQLTPVDWTGSSPSRRRSNRRFLARKADTGAPVSLIYNGVDLQRYNHQQPCCTLHDDYSIPESSPIVGVVARLEAEKATGR